VRGLISLKLYDLEYFFGPKRAEEWARHQRDAQLVEMLNQVRPCDVSRKTTEEPQCPSPRCPES